MTSINTNLAAHSALSVLRMNRDDLDQTLGRLATGLKVKTAADGASYWAIATTLRGDNGTLDVIRTDLGLGLSTISAANAGLTAAMNDLAALSAKLTSALSAQTDRAKIQTEIAAIQESLRSNAASASANGHNWLSIDSSAANPLWKRTETFVTGVPRGQDGRISIKSESLDVASLALFDKNTVGAHYPSINGSFATDPLQRVALDINAAPALNGQIFAEVVSGGLRLSSLDPSKTVTGSFGHSGGAPVAGTTAPPSQLQNASVTLPVSSLASGDVVTFRVSGGSEQTFTVTNQTDTLDFTGGNEVHFALRPHGATYPNVVYDILVNGSTLAGKVPDLAHVARADVAWAIADRISSEYWGKYQGTYSWSEIGIVETTNYVSQMGFQTTRLGPDTSIELGILPPTSGHTLIDVGFGTAALWPAVAAARDDGFYENDRRPKGILDSYDGSTQSSVSGLGNGIRITSLTSTDELQAYIRQVSRAFDAVEAASVTIGGLKTQLSGQITFAETLRQINTSAIGTLVDADIETESTRLKALQAQRDLSQQSLSLANARGQGLLTLFQ